MGWGTFIAGQTIRYVRRTKPSRSRAESELTFGELMQAATWVSRLLFAPVKSIAYALPIKYPKKFEALGRDYRVSHPPERTAKFASVLLWCLFFGTVGGHRFKTGKHGTAWLMLLTSGGLGIWYIFDLYSILTFHFKDYWGQTIRRSTDIEF